MSSSLLYMLRSGGRDIADATLPVATRYMQTCVFVAQPDQKVPSFQMDERMLLIGPPCRPADACVTHSQQRHDASVAAVAGYCRQRTAMHLAAEIRALRSQGAPAAGGTGATSPPATAAAD